MPLSFDDSSRTIAKVLFDVKAVEFNIEKLFQYVSGMLSPIYIDNRKIISIPAARKTIVDNFLYVLKEYIGQENFDVVAGVATGGVPWASWVAYGLDVPLVYVRPAPKDRGMKKQVEGLLYPGQRVVVIEDLITTGLSSVNAAEAIRDEGGKVEFCISIFSFDSQASNEKYSTAKLTKLSLTNLSMLLNVGESENQINKDQIRSITNWADNTLANFKVLRA